MPVRLDCPTKKTFGQFKSAISAIYLKMLKHFLGLLKKKLFTTNAQNICNLIGREEYNIDLVILPVLIFESRGRKKKEIY